MSAARQQSPLPRPDLSPRDVVPWSLVTGRAKATGNRRQSTGRQSGERWYAAASSDVDPSGPQHADWQGPRPSG